MNGMLDFALVAGAVIASIGLALGLEWLTLSGLFHAMPNRAAVRSEEQKTEK